ncbi:MAG: damage-inducible protein DinB [Flavobacteriaceae bacterium]|nr:MAG: damage-inducible protein DinB [Flavobacteriaceae bacterium]
MTNTINLLKKNRLLILKLIEALTLEQLNKIPEGFGNNIIWNVGHLAVTQQLLCYKLSRLPMHISDEMVDNYRKDSAPNGDVNQAEVDEIKRLFVELPDQFEKDYNENIFKEYDSYTTSVNVTLSDIYSASSFNNFHEGIHLGVILTLRKLV